MAKLTGKIDIDISQAIKSINDLNKLTDKIKLNIDSISDVDVKVATTGLESSNKDISNFNKEIDKIPKEKNVSIQTDTDTQATKEFIKQLDSIILQKKQALINSDLELKNQLRMNALNEQRKLSESDILAINQQSLNSSKQIKDTIEETYKLTKNGGVIEFGVNIDEKTKGKVLSQLQNIEVDIKFNQSAIDKAEASIKAISDLEQIEIDFDKSSIDKAEASIKGFTDKVNVFVDTDYDSIEKAKNEVKSIPNKADVVITADVGQVKTAIEKMKDSLKGLGEGAGGGLIDTFKEGGILGVGIAAATAGIELLTGAVGSFITGGFALNSAFQDLENRTKQFGFNVDELKNGAKDAFVGGVGGSVAEAAEIIGKAAVALKGVFDPQELTTFVIGAQALGNAFDKDVTEVVMKAEPFIKQFGLSGSEAFNLLTLSLRDAGTAQDDVLDSLAEYSQLAVQAGYSAEGFVNALTVGAKEGLFNTDKIADALKETQIRLKAGDIQKTFKDFADTVPKGLLKSIESTESLARTGQISIKEFLRISADGIEKAFQAGEISESIRSQLQIAISGTPAEDLGSDIYTKVFGASIDPNIISEKAKQAGDLISKTTGQYTSFESIQKKFTGTFEVLSAEFIKFADKFLSPIIGTLINGFEGIYNAVEPFVSDIIKTLYPIVEFLRDNFVSNLYFVIEVIKTNVTPIFTVLGKLFNRLVESLKPITDIFSDIMKSTQDLKDSLQGDYLDILKLVSDVTVEFGGLLIEFIVWPFEQIASWVKIVTEWFKSAKSEIGDTGDASKKAGGFLEGLKNTLITIKGVIAGVTSAFVAIKEAIGAFVTNLANLDIKKAIEGLAGFGDKVQSAYKKGFQGATNEAKKATDEQVKLVGKTQDEISRLANNLAIDFKAGKIDQKTLDALKKSLRADIDKSLELKTIGENEAKALRSQLNAIGKINEGIAKTKGTVKDTLAEEIALLKEKQALELNAKRIELETQAIAEGRSLNDNDKLILQDLEYKNLLKLESTYRKIYKIQGETNNITIGIDTDEKSKNTVIKSVLDIQSDLNKIRFNVDLAINKDIAELLKSEIDTVATNIKNIEAQEKDKLTVQYGVRVGLLNFNTDIDNLVNDIKGEIANINGLYSFATDEQKKGLDKSLAQLTGYLATITTEKNNIITQININAIEDRYEREKAVALFELEKKYNEELILIGTNEGKKLELYEKYINDKTAIEKKYAESSNDIYSQTTNNFLSGLLASFGNLSIDLPEIDIEKIDETKSKIKDLQDELKSLGKGDENSLLSYEAFKSEQNRIKDEIANLTIEIENEANKQSDIFKLLGDSLVNSFGNTFKSIADQSKVAFQDINKNYAINNELITKLLEEQGKLELDLRKANDDERFEDASKLYDKLMSNEELLTQKSIEETKLVNAAYLQMAVGVSAAFGQLIASGKATLGDFLLVALDALDSLVPILVAQITGIQLASPNPLNALTFGATGIASALALTALFKGLVAVAKAGIKGAEGGVIDLDSNYNKAPGKTDTIPFMLARGESVLTAKQTKEHKEFLEHISNGGNERTYFVRKFKDSLKFDNKTIQTVTIPNNNNISTINTLTMNVAGIEKGLNQLASLTRETNQKLDKLDNLDKATMIKGYNNHTITVNKKIVNEIRNNNYLG